MMYNNSFGRVLNHPILWLLLVASSAREKCGCFHKGELLCGCTDSRLLRVCLSTTTRGVSTLDGSQRCLLAGQWTQSWWSFLVSHGGWFSTCSSSGVEVVLLQRSSGLAATWRWVEFMSHSTVHSERSRTHFQLFSPAADCSKIALLWYIHQGLFIWRSRHGNRLPAGSRQLTG